MLNITHKDKKSKFNVNKRSIRKRNYCMILKILNKYIKSHFMKYCPIQEFGIIHSYMNWNSQNIFLFILVRLMSSVFLSHSGHCALQEHRFRNKKVQFEIPGGLPKLTKTWKRPVRLMAEKYCDNYKEENTSPTVNNNSSSEKFRQISFALFHQV